MKFLSLLLKLFETIQLVGSACTRGVSLNVGVRSVRCKEGSSSLVCSCHKFRKFAGEFVLLFVS